MFHLTHNAYFSSEFSVKYSPLVRREEEGQQKTQNYDVSSLIGEGVSVGAAASSPIVSAMVLSIILNLVNFSILYYQVRLGE